MILEKSRLDVGTPYQEETLDKERPPPYIPYNREASSSQPAILPQRPSTQPAPLPVRTPSTGNSVLNPLSPQIVNKFSLYSKQDPISGYFVIDPTLERTNKFIRIRSPLNSKNRKYFQKKLLPHAVFATKRGAIKLTLATQTNVAKPGRSYVQLHSHSGTVNATISPLEEQNHMCLEVSTKDGNVIVFVPPNFDGGIQFRSNRGRNAVNFLPEFHRRARVIHGSDRESFILFGNSDLALTDPKNLILDLCLLSTHSGQITVGVTGVDHYEEPKASTGFWQKFVSGISGNVDTEQTQL